MYDYHVHTFFSEDSSMDIEEAIQKGIQIGLKEIVFTDHAEVGVWRPDRNIVDEKFEIEEYFNTLKAYQEKYKNQIAVKIGIEMGLQKEEKDKIYKILEYPFDFILGSSHTIDRYDLYYKKIYENTAKKIAYEKYFKEILNIVKEVDGYNVYGHIDLIRRYAYKQYEDITLDQDDKDLLSEIFKVLIQKGKGIEVNTSGFRYGINSTNPDKDILKLYHDLGGEIITVGSDAHKVEDIGYRIKETYDLLKSIGYRYITTFKNKKPIMIQI